MQIFPAAYIEIQDQRAEESMKSVLRIVAILIAVGLMLALGGCAGTPPDHRAVLENGLCAELRGSMGEIKFCAKITVEKAPNGDAGKDRGITVEYLSPAVLQGISVCGRCNPEGSVSGTAEVLYGGTHLNTDASAVEGLLRPATAFFAVGETASVQKVGKTYKTVFEDGAYLITDMAGAPLSFSSQKLSFEVVWHETS